MTTEYTFINEKFELKRSKALEDTLQFIFKDFNKQEINLSYIFCSDEYLLQINREYLDHDYYTDVITFPPGHEDLPADIFISIDRIKENAAQFGVDFYDELFRVMIHGVLHLCGLNDADEEEKLQMQQNENHYLEHLKTQAAKANNS